MYPQSDKNDDIQRYRLIEASFIGFFMLYGSNYKKLIVHAYIKVSYNLISVQNKFLELKRVHTIR